MARSFVSDSFWERLVYAACAAAPMRTRRMPAHAREPVHTLHTSTRTLHVNTPRARLHSSCHPSSFSQLCRDGRRSVAAFRAVETLDASWRRHPGRPAGGTRRRRAVRGGAPGRWRWRRWRWCGGGGVAGAGGRRGGGGGGARAGQGGGGEAARGAARPVGGGVGGGRRRRRRRRRGGGGRGGVWGGGARARGGGGRGERGGGGGGARGGRYAALGLAP